MYESLDTYLRPSTLSSTWGLRGRMTAYVLGQLEALGFGLPADGQGARRVHPDLAEAVRLARSEGRELETLRADPALRKFLTREAAAEFDPANLLVNLAGEVSLVRAVVGALVEGTRLGTPSYWRPPDWKLLGLPQPKGEL